MPKLKNFKVTACYNYGAPGSIPTPVGFNWHQLISFNVESTSFPKKIDLKKRAIQEGAKTDGLDILFVQEIPEGWEDVEEVLEISEAEES